MTEAEAIERIARAALFFLVVYCMMAGDHYLDEWDDAKDWQRESTIKLVKSVLSGTYSAAAEHAEWLQRKVSAGYTYGAEKNDDKTKGTLPNPAMLEYSQVSLFQRMKNILQPAVIIGMAAHYGLTVSKTPELVFA